jgi:hypothetical protein
MRPAGHRDQVRLKRGLACGDHSRKQEATIEVSDERARVLATSPFSMDRDGYRQLLATGRKWPHRLWAV